MIIRISIIISDNGYFMRIDVNDCLLLSSTEQIESTISMSVMTVRL